MTTNRRGLALAGILSLTLLVGVSCSSDDSGDDAEAATATEAAATAASATGAATEAAATEAAATTATTATTEAMDEAAFGLDDLDGLSCTGQWTNETFGSTGSFAATFSAGDGGGNVSLELGGNVFGGQGGTVDAPFTTDGETTVIDADLGFLGMAMLAFNGTSAQEAVLNSPPALGEGAKATITDFAFDGETLTAGIDIEFANNGGTARSVVESTCG